MHLINIRHSLIRHTFQQDRVLLHIGGFTFHLGGLNDHTSVQSDELVSSSYFEWPIAIFGTNQGPS